MHDLISACKAIALTPASTTETLPSRKGHVVEVHDTAIGHVKSLPATTTSIHNLATAVSRLRIIGTFLENVVAVLKLTPKLIARSIPGKNFVDSAKSTTRVAKVSREMESTIIMEDG